MNPNVMNIFCSINNNYTEQLCVTMVSILENNQWGSVRFYVLTSDLTEASRQKVRKVNDHYSNCSVEFIKVDRDLFRNSLLNRDHITVEAYYRYLIADIAPDLERALYLDVDVVVNRSLKPLWTLELEGNYIAGVCDLPAVKLDYKPHIGLSDKDLYINSGVLLLDLSLIRQDNLVQRFFENEQRYSDIIKYQDQDIINLTCKGKIKEVDSIYNYGPPNVEKEPGKRKNAVVIHYYGPSKPWHWDCNHPLRHLWIKYAKINKKIQNQRIRVGLIVAPSAAQAAKEKQGYYTWTNQLAEKYFPNQNVTWVILLGKSSRHRFWYEKRKQNQRSLYYLPGSLFLARMLLQSRHIDAYLVLEPNDGYVRLCDPDWEKKTVIIMK